MIGAIIARDVRRSYASGQTWLPVIFYLSVATLFPFAVGPDRALLLQTGGGILWIAALLATLLPIDRLLRPDIDHGFLDRWIVAGLAEEVIAFAKTAAHWLAFAPPLLLAGWLASLLMGLEGAALGTLLLGLAIATPALAALAVLIAALTASFRGSSALAGLLLVPLAVPVLIFGAGTLRAETNGALLFLAAVSLFVTATAPFAAGLALRTLRE